MQLAQLVDLRLKDLQLAASKKRQIAALKCCRRCQQLSRQLLVLFGKLDHAVIRSLQAMHEPCINPHLIEVYPNESSG